MSTTETLLITWEHQVPLLTQQADQRRNNGMRESAAIMRAQRDQLKACAEQLREALGLPKLDQTSTAPHGPDLHHRRQFLALAQRILGEASPANTLDQSAHAEGPSPATSETPHSRAVSWDGEQPLPQQPTTETREDTIHGARRLPAKPLFSPAPEAPSQPALSLSLSCSEAVHEGRDAAPLLIAPTTTHAVDPRPSGSPSACASTGHSFSSSFPQPSHAQSEATTN